MKNTLEEIIESFSVEPPTYEYWDKLTDIPVCSREVYGVIRSVKPNDHCYWNLDFGLWEENDEHFRNRIKEMMNEKC